MKALKNYARNVSRLLPLIVLSACGARQSLPPGSFNTAPNAAVFNRYSTPSTLRNFSATPSGGKFNYGLGMRLDGAQPMTEDGNTFSVLANRPEVVDLRAGFGPVYNQGATQACVGFSTVGGLGEYFARKRGWTGRFSPRFLWSMGRKMEGTLGQNQGMLITDAQKIMDAYGMLPEASFPFASLSPEQNPTVFEQMLPSAPVTRKSKKPKNSAFLRAGRPFLPFRPCVPL